MSIIPVTPFAPGIARGKVSRNREAILSDSIVLLRQQNLAAFTSKPAGIIVIEGAPLSHPMIHLLRLGIPVVIIPGEQAGELEEDMEITIDGYRGRIMQSADSTSATACIPEIPPAGRPIILNDGSRVALRASIYGSDDASLALRQGAESIGLVRTEFIVPADGSMPDADFYRHELARLCTAAESLAVTLRLPDIAADKQVPWLEPLAGLTGPLGLQGIRLYHQRRVRAVLDAMIEAVNSLSAEYKLSLLLPYVVRHDEFIHWRTVIQQQLQRPLPIGVMAETPSAVLALANWFDVADFVAIGCNDLMQCLFAADRDIAQLRHYLDPYSPQLYAFLQQAAASAAGNIERVQVCGLLAQFPGVLPVLLGLGFRNFSVAPAVIPHLAATVKDVDLDQARELARQVCAARDSQQVGELLGLRAG